MVTKLINRAMKDGKKTVIEKEVYRAFEIIKDKTKEDLMNIFKLALQNIMPTMEVRARRIGGAAYQVHLPGQVDHVLRRPVSEYGQPAKHGPPPISAGPQRLLSIHSRFAGQRKTL